MGLKIGKQTVSGSVVVDRRLWLTTDKDRLVEDGDPAAAFLWSSAGKKRPAEQATALGYKPGGSTKSEPEEAASEEAAEQSATDEEEAASEEAAEQSATDEEEAASEEAAEQSATDEEEAASEEAAEQSATDDQAAEKSVEPSEDKAAPEPPNKGRKGKR